jgi:hypothetical protein
VGRYVSEAWFGRQVARHPPANRWASNASARPDLTRPAGITLITTGTVLLAEGGVPVACGPRPHIVPGAAAGHLWRPIRLPDRPLHGQHHRLRGNPEGSILTTYTFQDEFDGPAGSASDPHKWSYDTGRWTVNTELETYAASAGTAILAGTATSSSGPLPAATSGGTTHRTTAVTASPRRCRRSLAGNQSPPPDTRITVVSWAGYRDGSPGGGREWTRHDRSPRAAGQAGLP